MSASQLESGTGASDGDPGPGAREESESDTGSGRGGGESENDETASEASEPEQTASEEMASEETVSEDPARDAPRVGSPARRWIVRACAAVIVVIAIVSTVFAGIFGWKLRQRDEVDDAARQALSTAQTYAIALTSIDSQHIDADYTHVLDGATGDFKNMYAQSSSQLKKMLVDNKARSTGKVVSASVQSASENQVVVMLFVDQDITNSVSPDPRVDRSRILMTMQRVGGRWLAGKVEML